MCIVAPLLKMLLNYDKFVSLCHTKSMRGNRDLGSVRVFIISGI